MKKSSTIFLQVVVVLVGLFALFLLLLEPRIEGVNQGATFSQIYFDDPFLALVYIGSIPFFVALYKAIKVLGYVGENKVFSQPAVDALRAIKYCALTIIGFIVVEELWIFLSSNIDTDNPGAPLFLGLIIAFGCAVVGVASAVIEKTLQSAVDLKSENDLTV